MSENEQLDNLIKHLPISSIGTDGEQTIRMDGLDEGGGPSSLTFVETDEEDLPLIPLSLDAGSTRYVFLALLGKGGMGEVWRVWDQVLERSVAMKILRKRLAGHTQMMARFFSEARVGAGLQHPDIAGVYEVGQLEDGRPYFTMREVQGETFAKRSSEAIETLCTSNFERTRQYVVLQDMLHVYLRVCETVAYAHSRQIVHRDLKPDNIMIGSFGEVQVLDWGIARSLGDPDRPAGAPAKSALDLGGEEATKVVAGTPHYMAPEQGLGSQPLGLYSDVYSLGAMLYGLLSGRPPFADLQGRAVLKAVLESEPGDLSSGSLYTIDTSSLQALSVACMSPEGTERPTANEVAQGIRAWLLGSKKQERSEQALVAAERAEEKLVELAAEEEHEERLVGTALDQRDFDSGWEHWQARQKLSSTIAGTRQAALDLLIDAIRADPSRPDLHARSAHELIAQLVDAELHGDNRRRLKLLEIIAEIEAVMPASMMERTQQSLAALRASPSFSLVSKATPLFGRQALLRALLDELNKPCARCAIVGRPGLGKTRIFHEIIADWERRGHPTIYCDLEWAQSLTEVVDRVDLRSLGWTTDSDQEIQQREALLVLDRASCSTEVLSEVLKEWVSFERLRVLVVGPEAWNLGLHTVHLERLDIHDAVRLFEARGGLLAPGFQLSDSNWSTVVELVRECDGVPMAIELIASQLRYQSVFELKSRVLHDFANIRIRDGQGASLERALDWSWSQLDEAAQFALVELSVFRGPLRLFSAEDVLSSDAVQSVADRLQALTEAHFLDTRQDEQSRVWYRLPQLARLQLSRLIGNDSGGDFDEAIRAATARHAAHYTGLISLGAAVQTEAEARGLCPKDEANIRAVVQEGGAEQATLCALFLADQFKRRGTPQAAIHALESVLERDDLSAIQRRRVQIHQAALLNESGAHSTSLRILLDEVSSPDTSASKAAPSVLRHRSSAPRPVPVISKEVDYSDPVSLISHGLHLATRDQVGAGLAMLEQARRLLADSSDHVLHCRISLAFATILNRAGRLQKASVHLDAADASIGLKSDEILQADCWLERARNLFQSGRNDEAIPLFKRVLDVFDARGQISRIVLTKSLLASSLKESGRFHDALDQFREGLEIGKRNQMDSSLASLITNMCDVFIHLGEHAEAMGHLQHARQYAEGPSGHVVRAFIGHNLARCFYEIGDWSKAQQHWLAAIDEVAHTSFEFDQFFRSELAELLALLGRRQQARALMHEASTAHVSDPVIRVEQHTYIGVTLWLLGDEAAARKEMASIEELRESIQIRKGSPLDASVQRLTHLIEHGELLQLSQVLPDGRRQASVQDDELNDELCLESDRWFHLAERDRIRGAYIEARKSYHQSAIRSQMAGAWLIYSRALHGEGLVVQRISGYPAARVLLERALEIRIGRCGEDGFSIQSALGEILNGEGDFQGSLNMDLQRLQQVDPDQDRSGFLRLVNNIAHGRTQCGPTPEDLTWLQSWFTRFADTEMHQSLLICRMNLAVTQWCLGQVEPAAEALLAAMNEYSTSRFRNLMDHAHGWLGRIYAEGGNLLGAESMLNTVHQHIQSQPDRSLALFSADLAAVQARQGDMQRANEWSEGAKFSSPWSWEESFGVLVASIQIHACGGRLEQAEAARREAQDRIDALRLGPTSSSARMLACAILVLNRCHESAP